MTTDNDSARKDFFDWLEARRKDSVPSDPRYLEVWQAARERYAPTDCAWTSCDMGSYYETRCGNCFTIIDGTPEDNDMKHCCYCGGHIVAAPNGGNGS